MTYPTYTKLLKSPVYLPFFISQVLTNLCDGLLAVSVIYFAVILKVSPWELGVITFAITLSRGFLGPVGGVIGDRMNKKTYLVTIEILRTLLMMLLFVLYMLESANIWVLMIFGVGVSTLFAISVPAAKAVIPKLASDEELQLANGLIQTITWPAYFLGSGLLAILVPLNIESLSFFIVTIFFALSSVLLMFIPRQATGSANQTCGTKNLFKEILQGYTELNANSVMHARVWAYGIFTFFWRGTLQILIPLAVLQHLNSPAWVYGALMFVNGAGEFVANLVVGKLQFKRPLVFTFLCEVLLGIGILFIFVSFMLPVPEIGLLLASLLIGIAAATIDIPLLTVIQRNVAEHNVGKVVSYWFTIGSAGGALGNLALGLYFEFIPLETGTFILGTTVLLIGMFLFSWARRTTTYVAEFQLNS